MLFKLKHYHLTVNEFVKNNYLNLLIPLEENLSEGIHADGKNGQKKHFIKIDIPIL